MTKPGGFAGVTEFWDLRKPVIAAVNGAAVGGEFEIALAADLIIAAEHAHFALPEMIRGFVPDAGGFAAAAATHSIQHYGGASPDGPPDGRG